MSKNILSITLATMMIAAPAAAQEFAAAGSGTSRVEEAGSGSSRAVEPAQPESKCTRCGERTFGTSVNWVNSVPEAAKKAQQEQKLVFVLHVSGHFENAGYT